MNICDFGPHTWNWNFYILKIQTCNIFFQLCPWKSPRSNDTRVARNKPRARILVSKYHSPPKGSKTFWRNGWFRRWCEKTEKEPTALGSPTCHIGDNSSIKINKGARRCTADRGLPDTSVKWVNVAQRYNYSSRKTNPGDETHVRRGDRLIPYCTESC